MKFAAQPERTGALLIFKVHGMVPQQDIILEIM